MNRTVIARSTNATIEDIAKQHLRLSTLETRNADSLDFHEIGVWQLRAALEAAFQAGQAAATKSPKRRARGSR